MHLGAQGRVASRDDTAKVNLLNRMATSLRETDHELALQYAQDALALATRLQYDRGRALALGNMGWLYYRKTDFVKALESSFEAIKLSEQIGEKAEIGRSRNNVAAVYFEQKQYDKCLAEFAGALAIGRQLGDKNLIGRTLNNMAYAFLMGAKQYDSARMYGSWALQESERLKDAYLTAFALRTLGDVLNHQGKTKEAINSYQRAIGLAERNKNNSMRTATYHRLARVYMNQRRYEEAEKILKQNEDIALRYGYREELERTYQVLADLHRQTGRDGAAYEYLQKYTQLHDSIYSARSSEQLALMQGQFELDLKEAEIALLTKEAALRQEEIGRQRMQLYITILAASGALLLVILLLYGFQRSKRINRELELQKEELARKNREIEEKRQELSRLNATKDKLFSIIGHDFRSPLNSLKGLLGLIGNRHMSQQEFETFSVDLRKKIDVVYDNLDNILNWSVTQLRGIQSNPSVIQPHQLTEEVFALYQEMAQSKDVELVNQLAPELLAFADKDQVRLVLRNLISNALKFTSAGGYVRLSAEAEKNMVQIAVEDTGIGMTSEDMQKLFVRDSLWSVHGTKNEKGLGLGLLLCKEFIEKNQGELTVASTPGVGTTFRFSLPLPNHRDDRPGDVPAPVTRKKRVRSYA